MEDLSLRLAAVLGTLVITIGCVSARAEVPNDAPADEPAPKEEVQVFGPVPFVESEPLLAEMRALLAERAPNKRALTAGYEALHDWLARPRQDPLARPTGQWLEARLLTALGRKADARAAWEALATTPGPFSDDARAVLAELDDKDHRPAAAAHWRLTRNPWSPGFLDGAKKASRDLERLKQPERAVELIEQALMQGMEPRTRTELVLMLADLQDDAGHREHARDILLQTWWMETGTPDARLVRALKAMKAAPAPDLDFFRVAMHASRGASAELLAKPPRRTARGPIYEAALALLARWDDKDAEAALKSLPGKSEADADVQVVTAIARGMLLRKLDRDHEAIASFLVVHEKFADHPLVHEARDQAAALLRADDEPGEADALDRALIAHALPGERHRDALWRLGFGAVLARKPKDAEENLRALEWRHGGDPDRHSFCWFERARYWRGRAAQLAGDNEAARSLWTTLVQRYPAGWYALVARARLGDRPERKPVTPAERDRNGVEGWDVASDDPMATALALYRLGEERLAQTHFEALLDENQLPGNGRRLLSDLLELAGDARGAERVLRHAAIPPTMPGDDPDETYYDWYPLRFEEALGDAARKNGLPSSLLAGVVSVETRFSASAKSHAGAIGAAQLLKTTGAAIGRKLYGKDFDARTLTDPDVNLAVAARYLADLVERFHGHPALAVAAYNAGPAPVQRWLEQRGRLELDAFVETIPFEQARRYVMRVLSDAEIYRRLYGLDGEPIALPLQLDRAAKR